jgi:hypothetical protein
MEDDTVDYLVRAVEVEVVVVEEAEAEGRT